MAEGAAAALGRLGEAQKPTKGAPAYSRFVNRPLGRRLAAWSYQLGMTPNQVTATSATFSGSAILLLLFARPAPVMGFSVAVLLAVGYALDSADGQLARLTGGGTPVGEWLDHVVDSVKTCSLHLAVLVSFYRSGSTGLALLAPVLFTAAASITFFVIILNDQLRRAHGTAADTSTKAPILRSLFVAPTDYGVIVWVFALIGWPTVFNATYTFLLCANLLFLFGALVKWYREMAALGTRTELGGSA